MAFAASGVSDDLIQMTLLGEALDSAAVAVFVFDEDGNILAVNRKGCELTGYVRDRLLEPRRGDSADPAAIPHRLREIAICGVPSESSRSEPRTACSHPVAIAPGDARGGASVLRRGVVGGCPGAPWG